MSLRFWRRTALGQLRAKLSLWTADRVFFYSRNLSYSITGQTLFVDCRPEHSLVDVLFTLRTELEPFVQYLILNCLFIYWYVYVNIVLILLHLSRMRMHYNILSFVV